MNGTLIFGNPRAIFPIRTVTCSVHTLAVFKSALEATRQRRQRGTRKPLDWRYSSREYLFVIFLAVVFPAGGGIDLAFRHEAVWQRLLGLLLLALVATEVALFVRWLRKPVDPDALALYYQTYGGAPDPSSRKIPPRSKW